MSGDVRKNWIFDCNNFGLETSPSSTHLERAAADCRAELFSFLYFLSRAPGEMEHNAIVTKQLS